ncbi:tetratricopeptide repeat protein [Spirillospora sp. CA-142024]|uniref:tetratricopeptide repeat protein n=1 Tax=Spirillospora sp. CA-142024 TaxID=3240036 RepID=UPI003D8BFD6A
MISLCLIVLNETAYLEGCVRSARPFVDEVVIIDTGSTDGTVDLAWKLADTFAEVPFDGDFSAARNEALVRATGDWILFLDADERLMPAEGARLVEQLEQAPEDTLGLRLLRYNFFADGGFYTGRELKVFRNRPDVQYRRKINESVAASIAEAGGRVAAAPVLMNHFGHSRSVADRSKKAYTYLSIMDRQLAERPQDGVLLGYKGLILRTLGRFGEALEYSDQSIAVAPSSATVQLFRGHVLRSVGRDGEALEAYQRGIELAPEDPAPHNMAGLQMISLGQRHDAADAFRRALRLDPEFVHAHINLGLLAQMAGRWAEAIELFERAGARNPGFYHDDMTGRVERDPYRAFYNETILGYAGLGYHLGYCAHQLAGRIPPSGR